MKELEKKFFKYCIKNISHSPKWYTLSVIPLREGIYFTDLICSFSEKYNCNKKQLYYYLEKWNYLGIIDYGVSLRTGWFDFSKGISDEYLILIPRRTIRKNFVLCNCQLPKNNFTVAERHSFLRGNFY